MKMWIASVDRFASTYVEIIKRVLGLAVASTMALTGASMAWANETLPVPKCAASKARDVFLSGYLPSYRVKPVSRVQFLDATGTPQTVDHWQGRGLLLNFWATWCPPCVKELPALHRLKELFHDKGVDVIAVNIDKPDTAEVQAFLRKVGAEGLVPYTDPERKFMNAAKVASMPTTLLVDSKGNEVAGVLRDAHWDDPDIAEFVAGCIGHPVRRKPALQLNGE